MQFIHGDLLGSTRLMTEGSDTQTLGEPTARGEYLAFGGVLDLSSHLGGTGVSPAPTVRYGWCGSWGYENDALESGTLGDDEQDLALLHIGARYYSPDVGRWVQRDPIGVWGGQLTYGYCGNVPTACVDPRGLMSTSEAITVAGVVGNLLLLGGFLTQIVGEYTGNELVSNIGEVAEIAGAVLSVPAAAREVAVRCFPKLLRPRRGVLRGFPGSPYNPPRIHVE
ncbi:MAG: RHS repeat-associated core domain-containing protein [Parvularculaceae bacterium]|nr:RHS repeat-associated core domain-containing protein [Parvularculaceae bacterium]